MKQLLMQIANVLAGINKDDLTDAERQIAKLLLKAGYLRAEGRTDGETYVLGKSLGSQPKASDHDRVPHGTIILHQGQYGKANELGYILLQPHEVMHDAMIQVVVSKGRVGVDKRLVPRGKLVDRERAEELRRRAYS